MRLHATTLAGVMVVEAAQQADERGLFARTFDQATFAAAGLPTDWPQCNTSWNRRRGTLRGMHLQAEPYGEPKLVRCTRGRVFDVAIDLRPASASFRHWFGLELAADRRTGLFIPAGGLRIPHLGGRQRDVLPDGRRIQAEPCRRRALERSGLRRGLAVRAGGDVRAGRRLAGLHRMMRLLISGASGFLGRHCLRQALALDFDEVHAVNRRGRGDDAGGRVRWHGADLRDGGEAARLMADIRPTHLLHAAWEATPGVYLQSPENLRWLTGTIALAEAFAEHGGRRFVGFGSGAEDDDEAGLCDEDRTLVRPSSLYGKCKAACWLAVQAVAQHHGLSAAGRSFQPFWTRRPAATADPVGDCRAHRQSPGQDDRGTADPRLCLCARRGSALPSPGPVGRGGSVQRRNRARGAIRHIVATLGERFGRPDLLDFGAVPMRPGEPPSLVADMTKVRSRLGWAAPTTVEAGLETILAGR